MWSTNDCLPVFLQWNCEENNFNRDKYISLIQLYFSELKVQLTVPVNFKCCYVHLFFEKTCCAFTFKIFAAVSFSHVTICVTLWHIGDLYNIIYLLWSYLSSSLWTFIEQEYIPVRCVPPASVAVSGSGVCVRGCTRSLSTQPCPHTSVHTPPSTLPYPYLLPRCMLVYTPCPWTEWLTDICKNITFPQLRLPAVKICPYRVARCPSQVITNDGFSVKSSSGFPIRILSRGKW